MSGRPRPPAPEPLPPRRALWRALRGGQRDLLNLLPDFAYEVDVAPLGRSRRGILLVNDPDLVRDVFDGRMPAFPKNDLFVGALSPLIGSGVFIADGADWARKRRMIEASFGHLRMERARPPIAAALDAFTARMDERAGAEIALDAELSRLTADAICRAVFSLPLESVAAAAIFADFERFQATVANVRLGRLLLGRPWARAPQPRAAREAAARIRERIRALLRPRLARGAAQAEDICGDLIAARDPEDGSPFSEDELLDELAVFILAGHETTASAVTWALLLLALTPDHAATLREEAAGPGARGEGKAGGALLALMREAMRLYPPGPFLPRMAREACAIGGFALDKGAMVMVSPWIIHRHRRYWDDADRFDPHRFAGAARPGRAHAYLPFGLGPRGCIGAGFAQLEGTAILARILGRYRVDIVAPERARPTAKLTIRPAAPIRARLRRLA